MNGESRFDGDNLDSILGSVTSEDRTSTVAASSDEGEYSGGEMFRHRFYGDNMDSLMGSEYIDDDQFCPINWDDEMWSRPPSPLTDISIPNTPDTVGEYPNVIKASLSGGPTLTKDSPNKQQISFNLGNFPTDAQLQQLYPQQIERIFAVMARDFQLLAHHHTMIVSGLRSLISPLSFESSGEPILHRRSIPEAMAAAITMLSSLKDMAARTLVHSETDLQGTSTCPPAPWLHWPSNTKSVYLSKLLSTYTGMAPTLRPEQVEIADYAIASHPLMDPKEQLFHDGCKVQVGRSQMISMEQGEVCNPAIVSAWGRILEYRRQGTGLHSATCLDVLDNDNTVGGVDGVVDHWEDWLKSAQIDIHRAELIVQLTCDHPSMILSQVFIPVKMRNHYTLFVINFNDATIQSIDGVFHSDQPAWDLMGKHVVFRLLDRIKHKHCDDLHHFRYQLVNPKWSTNDERPDSAIEVMHLMDVYDGNPSSICNMLLNEDQLRNRLNVAFVADIVTSNVNVCRDEALANLPRFIEDKCNGRLRPLRQVVQYRQVCGWLAHPDI